MARHRTKPCKCCGLKPAYVNGFYSYYDSEMELASGGYACLYIAANAHGDIVMRASGDDYTYDYHPNYCPNCGRKLTKEDIKV